MDYYLAVLQKYAVFSGRARRAEYWYFLLFHIIVITVLSFLSRIIGFLGVMLMGLYSLGVIIPHLAVAVRRLHDTNRSGWFLLVGLVPFVGGIILIVFLAQDSQPGVNQYGPNPKEVPPNQQNSTIVV